MKPLLILSLFIGVLQTTHAKTTNHNFFKYPYQQLTQQIRGTVVDQILQAPVAGVTVTLVGSNKSVLTDASGSFKFTDVAVGTQQLRISHIAYKAAALDNIMVNAGKELVLTIPLETLVRTENEVVVKSSGKKNKPLNDMSAVSARAFTVEETQKYAAAVNDPLRMATGFPGVVAANDGNNDIVIRGNAPTGLLWRMEGVDIPNPNHFSSAGSSGGGISILSAQLLSNSDFVTGAFASEYGNALSGVFDLKLRKGNNERKEYTLQAGLLGLNAAAEGPFSPFYKGSYLINYRYSTLQLLNKIGIPLETGSTNFQDLSYNFSFPTRKLGTFTLFGFGGLSSQRVEADKDSTKWQSIGDRFDSKFISNTGATGITHNILLSNKTSLRSAIAYALMQTGYNEKFIERDYNFTDTYRDDYKTKKIIASSTLNHRFNNRNTLRAGTIVNFINFNYYQRSKESRSAPLKEVLNVTDHTQTLQAFAQWQYKPTNDITFNMGAHYLHLLYNNTASVEPRASVSWSASRKSSFAVGYGLHSQMQALGVYFAQTNNNGVIQNPNKNLGFTKAHHLVLSHSYMLGKSLKLKTEVYHQHLFNVPISVYDSITFSTLNIQGDFVTQALTNKGKGRNYGVEVSLEKYLSNNFYYMASTSLYQSKYTAADGIERDTRFNGNRVATLLMGKDFVSTNKHKTFGINVKTIYAGGFRNTPIDIDASKAEGYTIFKQREAFTEQNPDYFRTDLRLSMKWNKKNRTSTLSLDIQNVSNRLNLFNQWYDADKGAIVNNYQNGIIPVLNYKIEF